jgi:hypothetical protein
MKEAVMARNNDEAGWWSHGHCLATAGLSGMSSYETLCEMLDTGSPQRAALKKGFTAGMVKMYGPGTPNQVEED